MVASEIESKFYAEVGAGTSIKEALSIITEGAKSKQRYKRFGTIHTTIYEFWDKSVLVVGEMPDRLFIRSALNAYEADYIVLTGTWDSD